MNWTRRQNNWLSKIAKSTNSSRNWKHQKLPEQSWPIKFLSSTQTLTINKPLIWNSRKIYCQIRIWFVSVHISAYEYISVLNIVIIKICCIRILTHWLGRTDFFNNSFPHTFYVVNPCSLNIRIDIYVIIEKNKGWTI